MGRLPDSRPDSPSETLHETPAESYDAVIIGSGIGGLAAGSLLAQLGGRRVCVLERHFTLGGFTHAFTRRGYHWDVGLHYVGQMGKGEQSRRLMDLVTGGEVDWQRLPEEFDVFHYPCLLYTSRCV